MGFSVQEIRRSLCKQSFSTSDNPLGDKSGQKLKLRVLPDAIQVELECNFEAGIIVLKDNFENKIPHCYQNYVLVLEGKEET